MIHSRWWKGTGFFHSAGKSKEGMAGFGTGMSNHWVQGVPERARFRVSDEVCLQPPHSAQQGIRASQLQWLGDVLKRDDVNATKKDIAQHSSSASLISRLAFRMYRSAKAIAEKFRLLSIISDRAVHWSLSLNINTLFPYPLMFARELSLLLQALVILSVRKMKATNYDTLGGKT